MRHMVLVMVLAAGCGSSRPAPAPAATPSPATPDPSAEKLDRVLERMDAYERQLSALEERLAALEEDLADAEVAEAAHAAEAEVPVIGPLPPTPVIAPPAPAPVQPRPGGHDPAAVYAIPADGHPYEGTAQAVVTIVEAREFACPYCDRVRPTIAQLLADYPGKLKVVYRNMVVHPQIATLPAQAACAAEKQGQYVAMANLIYDKGFNAGRDLSRARMEDLAIELSLDLARFTADMDGPCVKRVADDQAELARFGVRATPTFFINGRHLSGAQPIDRFKAVVDEELAKAASRPRKTTRARDYYRVWVVGKGKKTGP